MIKTFGEASVSAGEIMKRQGTLDSNLSLASGEQGEEEEEEKEVEEVKEVKEEEVDTKQGSVSCDGEGVCDWSDKAVADLHMFVPSTSGVETCYLGQDCPLSTSIGDRFKCVSCKVVAHGACKALVQEKIKCKTTFNQSGVRRYRDVAGVEHHWVSRRQIKGKCRHCGKAFQSKVLTELM